jgi:NitT/TauT family transport system permease protein
LALVGAVVAEFVAGSGGFASGLAYRILEAGYRLQVPRMFAALVLLSLAGIAINFGLGAFASFVMRRRGDA